VLKYFQKKFINVKFNKDNILFTFNDTTDIVEYDLEKLVLMKTLDVEAFDELYSVSITQLKKYRNNFDIFKPIVELDFHYLDENNVINNNHQFFIEFITSINLQFFVKNSQLERV